MKVCIIGHTERNYLPFMDKYIAFFEKSGVEYDIVCWQREEMPLNPPSNKYYYFEEAKDGPLNKVRSYLRFRRYVLKLIAKNQYDKLVVLTTMPAVFLSHCLRTKYKGRYLFDFRDYSFEKFKPYKALVDKLIEDSELTTISSHGFMDFLGENKKIILNHNLPARPLDAPVQDIRQKQVINIGFTGTVRYYDENTALIDKLKNTFHYQLWYIGKPVNDCDLQGYCKEHDITNVSFVGKYDNAQKVELYKNIDIINSIYGNDSLEVTTALPNRLYEACLLKKPIISSKGTFLGEVIERYRLGIVVDVEQDDVLALVDEYVKNFDKDAFEQSCVELLADVANDEAVLYQQLKKFIRPIKPEKVQKKK